MAQKHSETPKSASPSRRPSPKNVELPGPENISEQLAEIGEDKTFIWIFLKWLQEWHESNPGALDDALIAETRKELEKIVHIHPENRDSVGLLNSTRDVISKLPLETAEKLVPMLHACNIPTRPHQVDNIAVAQVSLEKARVFSSKAVIESPMGLSEKHKDAAEGYVPPSRVGKKAIAGYFNEVVSAELKTLAAVQQRTVQSLLEEALSDLFIKHEPVMGVVRNALKRQP